MPGVAAGPWRGESVERVGVGETRWGGELDDCEGDRDGASDMLAGGPHGTGEVQLLDLSVSRLKLWYPTPHLWLVHSESPRPRG